jgi:CO/xanthine dehydrogenase FAD-binding subunit
MRPFEYFAPASLEEACTLLTEFGASAKILAGGTDVLVELRKPTAQSPKAVIDISRIPTLRGIEESGNSIIIKALTTHTEVLHSETVARYAALLRMSAAGIGSPLIRNRGTVGGNIMNAAACADTVPPLMALNAEIKLKSAGGERTMSLAEFFIKPYVTAAKRDEILIEIRFPKLPVNARSSFVKLGRRNALSISRLSVAAILYKSEDGVVSDARIVPGAAFPKWQRIPEAEKLLIGRKPSRELCIHAGKKVSDEMISLTGRRWSTEYKEPVIAVLTRRALEACMD